MTGDLANVVHANCPRCGYDLRGVVESWREWCPLHGECSECGGDLDWSRVIRRTVPIPRWSFEHHRGWRPFVGTLWRVFLPWTHWRGIQPEHPVRLRRALWFSALLFVLVGTLLYMFVQGATAVISVNWVQTLRTDYQKQMAPYAADYRARSETVRLLEEGLPVESHAMNDLAAFASAYLNRPDLSEDEVKAMLPQIRKEVELSIEAIEGTLELSRSTAVLEAIVTPLAKSSTLELFEWETPTLSPHAISELNWLLTKRSMRTLGLVLLIPLAVAGFAMSFLLALQSRHRSEHEGAIRHGARCGLSFVSIMVVGTAIGLAVIHVWTLLNSRSGTPLTPSISVGAMVAILAWFLYAWCEARWYFRIVDAFRKVIITMFFLASVGVPALVVWYAIWGGLSELGIDL